MRSTKQQESSYVYSITSRGRLIWEHRVIAEKLLQRRLMSHEIVHHIDCDKSNNSLDNLIVISRTQHARLHSYLGKQRVIMEKTGNKENFENYWSMLIASITLTWLETANVKTIKLSEVKQLSTY